MKSRLDKVRIGIFLGVAGLLAISHIYYFYGHFGVDDMGYARLAFDLSQGNYDWGNHYAYRLSILALTALSYTLFSINDLASGLPAMLLSLGIVYLLFDLHRDAKLGTLLIALGLYFCVRWNLFYADKLMPDIYVSAFVFFSWWSYQKLRQGKHSTSLNAIVFSLSLFLAFVSKGTVILILPLLLYYVIRDIAKGQHLRFWILVTCLHVIIYSVYFGAIAYLTGDILARFHAIDANSYFNACSYSQMPIEETYKRLSIDFFSFISRENIVIYLIIILTGAISGMRSRTIQNANNHEWLVTAAICLLSANFMTISLTSYNPTCLDIRHYLLFFPILACCCSQVIAQVREDKIALWAGLAICIAALAINRNIYDSTHILPLIGMMVLFILMLLPQFKHNYRIGSTLITLALLYPSIQYMSYSKSLNYASVKREFIDLLVREQPNTTIYCSHVAGNLGKYFLAFDSTNYKFRDIRRDSFDGNNEAFSILIKNWYCDWHSEVEENTYNEWLEYEGLVGKLRKNDKEIILVYDLKK